MKLITKNTDYAVMALRYLCKNKGKVTSVKDLTRGVGIPEPFLRTILQVLSQKKVLKSFRGRGGGFILATSPQKIFLGDLMRIFQGSFVLNECIFKKKSCPYKHNCVLKQKVNGVESQIIARLKSITLASLL
ncbi:MAG: hypothetical protein A3G33_03730 [Omnitrophica bacterium RIFCSPLOWO2_12_FULL_44_17]|uniref:Rrf2 family transcriptional regulator n=1 Tax=Candidatus Danuiimicrobium aquiferis TaxID=1801832 RepID=A0A1G1L2A4_9BACT|nr:MAG: hypothetical protein A3B72_08950 [Omnitrophica bacterium RIFCSPHIGHO2_02_FULL_45_28]OGW99292.1 MAG: hypothetical protein A3G33_03730 [Omnitrophica bacterium RIFCSPLOWO2_12_FULL_44_17]